MPERLSDVVREAVVPLSRNTRFGDVAFAARDGGATLPQKMVTHHWGNLFVDLVAAIVAMIG